MHEDDFRSEAPWCALHWEVLLPPESDNRELAICVVITTVLERAEEGMAVGDSFARRTSKGMT